MKYPLAERFHSIQGEGVHTGRPASFLRFVGCSVGKTVCTACDTAFEEMNPNLGGGVYSPNELADYCMHKDHIVLTGGEPLDRDLTSLLDALLTAPDRIVQIETSGTKYPAWLDRYPALWVTVSPKPGYLGAMIDRANEVKLIFGGLGDGPGWPTIDDALYWAQTKAHVFVQPRNYVQTINRRALRDAQHIVEQHPQLSLSVQLHKFLRVR